MYDLMQPIAQSKREMERMFLWTFLFFRVVVTLVWMFTVYLAGLFYQ